MDISGVGSVTPCNESDSRQQTIEEGKMAENQDVSMAVEAFKIGTKVRELREKNRFTLQDMAAKTGLSKEFLSQVESHEVVPPFATLHQPYQ
jgi:DNA-binding XRE family transcriptional regulator